MQGLHVVQTVGQLDQKHANVLGHRQHQLAEVLRLLGLVGLQLDPRQLGHAVDQPGGLLTKHALDVVEGRDRILNRIVQQPGDDRGAVELHLGEDAGDLDRMRKIGVAGSAQLCAMRLHRIDVGAVERGFVRVRIVGSDEFDQLELPHHDEHLAVSSMSSSSGLSGLIRTARLIHSLAGRARPAARGQNSSSPSLGRSSPARSSPGCRRVPRSPLPRRSLLPSAHHRAHLHLR